MNPDRIQQLQIPSHQKRRSPLPIWTILIAVALLTGTVLFFALPRASDSDRSGLKSNRRLAGSSNPSTSASALSGENASLSSAPNDRTFAPVQESLLTVSGYIINRERIEISPRFMGMVEWIGVKKGDAVTNGQVVVLLDDAEYQAQYRQSEGRLESAKVALDKAQLEHDRIKRLFADDIESKQREDNARLSVSAARAAVKELEGQVALIETYLDWCVIKSPIDGVVLEKLVDPNELVTPQSFGGTRGPSTALLAMADPKDLQVEIELNEADLSKIFLQQNCKISPEAYPDRSYDGFVAEIAPEANRQKGTLQVKVQIQNPDRFLTPELTARVDFLPKKK